MPKSWCIIWLIANYWGVFYQVKISLHNNLLTPADDGVKSPCLVEDTGKMILYLWLWRMRDKRQSSILAFSGGLCHLVIQVSRNEMFLGMSRDRENLRIKSVLHFSLQTTDCYYWNFGVEFCTTLQLSKQSRNIVGVQLSVFVSFFWLSVCFWTHCFCFLKYQVWPIPLVKFSLLNVIRKSTCEIYACHI